MAKVRGMEAKLARLHALRHEPASAEVVDELRRFLGDASNLVIAEAATIVGSQAVSELAPELAAAFDRLMIEPEKSDKRCRGKIALVEALNKIDYDQPEVYLRGIGHVQDPHFPPPPGQDAAGPLRAHCALGLAHLGQRGVLPLLTDLLLDTDTTARAGAARALGGTGSQAAVPLLRFKTQIGHEEPDVMGECFASLLSLAPDESLPFVARFLDARGEAVAGAALFALAETRRPEAFTLLEEFWPRAPHGLKESVLLALAMFRLQAAFDFLIAVIAQKGRWARAAVTALAVHRHNSKIKESTAAAVLANGDPGVQEWFAKKFAAASDKTGLTAS